MANLRIKDLFKDSGILPFVHGSWGRKKPYYARDIEQMDYAGAGSFSLFLVSLLSAWRSRNSLGLSPGLKM
jgi:hypothetical protein